jgi:hypothetical protein
MFEAALVRLKEEPGAATKDGRRILIEFWIIPGRAPRGK